MGNGAGGGKDARYVFYPSAIALLTSIDGVIALFFDTFEEQKYPKLFARVYASNRLRNHEYKRFMTDLIFGTSRCLKIGGSPRQARS
ncbi:hypothetical protein J2X69_005009 [Algoriphagus sp. 4150]|nr:hypothetical protein [Algoriphagus sp. 4150]